MEGARKKVGDGNEHIPSLAITSQGTYTMSSKRTNQAGFASKSMFDVLQNDEPEEEEVEEEDVSLDQVIEYVPCPIQIIHGLDANIQDQEQ